MIRQAYILALVPDPNYMKRSFSPRGRIAYPYDHHRKLLSSKVASILARALLTAFVSMFAGVGFAQSGTPNGTNARRAQVSLRVTF